jgi:hypothetical protein
MRTPARRRQTPIPNISPPIMIRRNAISALRDAGFTVSRARQFYSTMVKLVKTQIDSRLSKRRS